LLGTAQISPQFLASQRHQLRHQTLEASLQGISYDASGTLMPGVLETDELSFKYLSIAAEGGIPLAMQSLADNYEKGCGVRKSMRMCREWYNACTVHDNTISQFNACISDNYFSRARLLRAKRWCMSNA